MAKSRPRTGIPGVPGLEKVVNDSAHGEALAVKRYGQGTRTFPAPPDRSQPEDRQSRPDGSNDVPTNSWLRGGAKGGESYEHFDHGKKGKR